MLRTARLLPPTWLSTLGFDAGRFPPTPPACYRAPWRLPGRDSHPLAVTSLRTHTDQTIRPTALQSIRACPLDTQYSAQPVTWALSGTSPTMRGRVERVHPTMALRDVDFRSVNFDRVRVGAESESWL